MVKLTSHTLNGVDGTHASGIPVIVRRLDTGEILISGAMDSGGRLAAEIEVVELPDGGLRCEAVFSVADYWHRQGHTGHGIIGEIVLRFTIHDQDRSHHMPMIISPHGYSTWKSG